MAGVVCSKCGSNKIYLKGMCDRCYNRDLKVWDERRREMTD